MGISGAVLEVYFRSLNFPLVFCHDQNVLPVGTSDNVGLMSVKLYCPRCEDVFVPGSKRHQVCFRERLIRGRVRMERILGRVSRISWRRCILI